MIRSSTSFYPQEASANAPVYSQEGRCYHSSLVQYTAHLEWVNSELVAQNWYLVQVNRELMEYAQHLKGRLQHLETRAHEEIHWLRWENWRQSAWCNYLREQVGQKEMGIAVLQELLAISSGIAYEALENSASAEDASDSDDVERASFSQGTEESPRQEAVLEDSEDSFAQDTAVEDLTI